MSLLPRTSRGCTACARLSPLWTRGTEISASMPCRPYEPACCGDTMPWRCGCTSNHDCPRFLCPPTHLSIDVIKPSEFLNSQKVKIGGSACHHPQLVATCDRCEVTVRTFRTCELAIPKKLCCRRGRTFSSYITAGDEMANCEESKRMCQQARTIPSSRAGTHCTYRCSDARVEQSDHILQLEARPRGAVERACRPAFSCAKT